MMVLLTYPLAIFGQVYQLPNPGFEYWDNNYANSSDEPTNWNGFPSANCTIAIGAGTATQTRHERSTDIRPGSTGNYSCKIFATVVDLGLFGSITANGNITTGQINIASTSASDATKNYNFTKRSTSGLNQPFNAKPDSISFWTKFSCPSASQYARMSCIIHDNYDMHDPYTTTEQMDHIVAEAVKEYQQTNGWREFRIPFDYNHPASDAQYILLTFTTNKVAGEGSSSDFVWIDDITMIYHAELSDLSSDGVTVPGFSANVLDYTIELEYGASLPEVSYTTLSPRAIATVTQPTEANPTATVAVTHGDQTRTYTVHYTFAGEMDAALSDLQVNGETIDGFNPAVTEYDIVLFGTEVPTVSATPRNPDATVSITQPTADNLVASVAVTDRDSSRTYTVSIILIEPNADLSDLRLNGTTIEGFDPSVTAYSFEQEEGVDIPEISASAASEYATITISQFAIDDDSLYHGSVTVTCSELTKTYTLSLTITEPIVGITEQASSSFSLYPNPTNGQITISLNENTKATEADVYNVMGQTVMTQPVNGSQLEMNLNSLQSGIYFVAVRNGNKLIGIKKIVKE